MAKGSKEISSGKGDFHKGGNNSMYSVRYPKSGSKDTTSGGKGRTGGTRLMLVRKRLVKPGIT
jgi:hypothetical protein